MLQNPRSNPNILLTEICNLSCAYCFAKEKMSKTQRREMDINDFRKLLGFLKDNKRREIRLMGGEPTLHSRFREIVNIALSGNFIVRLFTNGTFSHDLGQWMAEKGESIFYSVNLTAIVSAPEEKRHIAEKNLNVIGKTSKIYGSITVDNASFERYRSVISLIEKNKFESVRISVANNMIANSGNGLISYDYRDIVSIIIKLVNKLKEAGISKISFNCGFVPCMFKEGQIDRLLKEKILLRGWGCKGKAGSFDVSSDLNILPCYASEELKTAKISDFDDVKSAEAYANALFSYTLHNSSPAVIKECRKCSFFWRKECNGPCVGYIMNNKENKKRLKEFKRSLKYKVARKIFVFLHSKNERCDSE